MNTNVTNYLANFRRIFGTYLRRDVGMQSVVYPYDGGAVIVMSFNFGFQTKDEYKKASGSLKEALDKTQLFEGEYQEKTVPGTSIILTHNNILLIKTDEGDEWSNQKAGEDVALIVSRIKKGDTEDGK